MSNKSSNVMSLEAGNYANAKAVSPIEKTNKSSVKNLATRFVVQQCYGLQNLTRKGGEANGCEQEPEAVQHGFARTTIS